MSKRLSVSEDFEKGPSKGSWLKGKVFKSNTEDPQTENKEDLSQSEKPWKRADILLSTICLNIFALVIPIVILQLYDRIIPNQSLNTLAILAFGVGLAVVFESILRISRSYILGWLGQRFDYNANTQVFSHLLGQNLYEINRMGTGEHIENLESLSTIKEFLAGQGFLVFLDLPFVFLFLGLMSYFGGWILFFSCVVILVLFVISALHVGHSLHKILEERQDIGDRKYNFVIELLNNYYTIKSLRMEEQFIRRFERVQFQTAYVEYKVNMMAAEARDLGSMFSSILFGAIIAVAGYEVIQNTISAGAMSACLFLSNRLIQPLQQGLGMWARFQYLRIAKKRFKKVFDTSLEATEGMKKILQGNISLRHLSFQYPETKKPLFKDLNLDVKSGEFITIVGKSGIGKTTLSQMMIGNLQPSSGRIMFDETPLENLNMPDFRSQLAYLTPRGEIFKGTVLENLTFFSNHDLGEEAMALSKEVGLDSWVSRLPQGYYTPIGTHLDDELPGGMIQRLCFVRVLLLNPKILILDEANTSLDIKGDQDLLQVLQRLKGRMTIVFITHRPSVAQMSDRVFQIQDQQIILKEDHSPHVV